MKLIKKANKTVIKMSKKEWTKIGKVRGWDVPNELDEIRKAGQLAARQGKSKENYNPYNGKPSALSQAEAWNEGYESFVYGGKA